MKPKSELILYQTEDNRTRIEVRLENETVWLSLNQMAELFQTTKQNVSLHIQNIYAEGELRRKATVKEYLTVQRRRKGVGVFNPTTYVSTTPFGIDFRVPCGRNLRLSSGQAFLTRLRRELSRTAAKRLFQQVI